MKQKNSMPNIKKGLMFFKNHKTFYLYVRYYLYNVTLLYLIM